MSPLLAAIVVASVTALLGSASYLYQKWADRRFELRKQQRDAYGLYLKSYHDWTLTEVESNEDKKAQEAYVRAYRDLFPLASDGFLKAAMAFHDFVWVPPYPDFSDNDHRARFDKLWTDLVVRMRKDANVWSRVKRDEIKQHMPWAGAFYQGSQDEYAGASEAEQTPDTPEEVSHHDRTE
ncbi:MAG TPA: hypothetical protein VFI90_06015 [Rubrobacter sp.]|nr:hypothetical protein [Rubrobacter sp.]